MITTTRVKNINKVMLSGTITRMPRFSYDNGLKRDYVQFYIEQEERINENTMRIRTFKVATSEKIVMAKLKKIAQMGIKVYVNLYGRLGIGSKINKRSKRSLVIRIIPTRLNIILLTRELLDKGD